MKKLKVSVKKNAEGKPEIQCGKCNVDVKFPIRSHSQLEHIFNAEEELSKAGVSFDTDANLPKTTERTWHFDWSLQGKHKPSVKCKCPLTNKINRPNV